MSEWESNQNFFRLWPNYGFVSRIEVLTGGGGLWHHTAMVIQNASLLLLICPVSR